MAGEVTQLLSCVSAGDREAEEKAIALVYNDLRRLARHYLAAERRDHTLQFQIVEMKFFGGLSIEEIARILHLSVRTVKRDWTHARAWFYGQLNNTINAG